MATIEQLCAQEKLEKVGGILEKGEMPMRAVYLVPRAATWMRDKLPSLKEDGVIEGALSPNQQAFQLMKDFVRGADLLATDWFPKPMRPREEGHGIWELRTADLRFFGWFFRKGIFIVASVETKAMLAKYSLYEGHRRQAVSTRENLELDEPKYLDGVAENVF